MKSIILTTVATATLIFATGCNGTKKASGNHGQNTAAKETVQLSGAWELTYISGPKIAFAGLFPNKKPLIFFDFPTEEASGNGGCNGYSVKVKVDGNKITFGDALSTMMACEGNGEQVFFDTLKKITSYSIGDQLLTLLSGDIALMRFIKK